MTETVTVLKKEPTCAELVDDQWRERQEDLKNPEYEALSFDYVAPHTWDDQPDCLLYTSPSPRDRQKSRMPSSA